MRYCHNLSDAIIWIIWIIWINIFVTFNKADSVYGEKFEKYLDMSWKLFNWIIDANSRNLRAKSYFYAPSQLYNATKSMTWHVNDNYYCFSIYYFIRSVNHLKNYRSKNKAQKLIDEAFGNRDFTGCDSSVSQLITYFHECSLLCYTHFLFKKVYWWDTVT